MKDFVVVWEISVKRGEYTLCVECIYEPKELLWDFAVDVCKLMLIGEIIVFGLHEIGFNIRKYNCHFNKKDCVDACDMGWYNKEKCRAH